MAVKRARRGKEVERGYISALCAALKAWPEVAIRRNVRGASFVVGRKFFAFTRPEGLAMKLPENRIRALVEAGEAQFLKMGEKDHARVGSLEAGTDGSGPGRGYTVVAGGDEVYVFLAPPVI